MIRLKTVFRLRAVQIAHHEHRIFRHMIFFPHDLAANKHGTKIIAIIISDANSRRRWCRSKHRFKYRQMFFALFERISTGDR